MRATISLTRWTSPLPVDELDAYVRRRGRSVADLLGEAADKVQTYQQQQDRPQYWREFVPPGG
jgi:dihydropyrimidine dehydrogenase (NAD+) subunit PreA/dihydroorotate dehydrogenase (NAD+) catalytic subunit